MTTKKADDAPDDLREELEALRKEVSEIMVLLKDKGGAYAEQLGDKMEEKLGAYQDKVQESAEAAYEKGNEGLEEISGRVRQNPVASLCIAFGLGYVISKLFEQRK